MSAPSLSTRDRATLWAGLLVGPGVWVAQLFLLYALEDIVACTPAARDPGFILGIEIRTLAYAITAIAAALALLAGLGALRQLRNLHAGEATPGYRWMATAGVLSSALFLGVILMKLLPLALVSTCAGGS